MEFIDENIVVDFNDYDILLPFAGDLNRSFEKIEEIIDNNGFSGNKLLILRNIVEVVDYLAEQGNVQEQLVFDTAQLYIMLKYTAMEISKVQNYFGKYVVEGSKLMVENFENFELYMKNIFENSEFLYLSKIKIADYIFELKQFKSKSDMKKSVYYSQAQEILKKYGDVLQKGLINELKGVIG